MIAWLSRVILWFLMGGWCWFAVPAVAGLGALFFRKVKGRFFQSFSKNHESYFHAFAIIAGICGALFAMFRFQLHENHVANESHIDWHESFSKSEDQGGNQVRVALTYTHRNTVSRSLRISHLCAEIVEVDRRRLLRTEHDATSITSFGDLRCCARRSLLLFQRDETTSRPTCGAEATRPQTAEDDGPLNPVCTDNPIGLIALNRVIPFDTIIANEQEITRVINWYIPEDLYPNKEFLVRMSVVAPPFYVLGSRAELAYAQRQCANWWDSSPTLYTNEILHATGALPTQIAFGSPRGDGEGVFGGVPPSPPPAIQPNECCIEFSMGSDDPRPQLLQTLSGTATWRECYSDATQCNNARARLGIATPASTPNTPASTPDSPKPVSEDE